jgi:hypothetical protein
VHPSPVLSATRRTPAANQHALRTHRNHGGSNGNQMPVRDAKREPVTFQPSHRNVGVRGVAPRKTLRPRAQTTEGRQACEAGTWARRDLNPHVLSDTRT